MFPSMRPERLARNFAPIARITCNFQHRGELVVETRIQQSSQFLRGIGVGTRTRDVTVQQLRTCGARESALPLSWIEQADTTGADA